MSNNSNNSNNIDISEIESGLFTYFENSHLTSLDYTTAKAKISNALTKYENDIKTTIMKNSDQIIKLFNHTKQIKEEFQKSRRNLESLESQILILKKKYIEPYDKFNLNVNNKKNIDQTIEVFEKIKIIKAEIKLMKIYFEKESIVMDSTNIINSFSKLKKNVKDDNIKDINFIHDDVNWFIKNEESILTGFRNKFYQAIKSFDNTQIKKFFSFFNSLEILTAEVRVYSNTILKEVLANTYYKKIVNSMINDTAIFDAESINRIRREQRDFFIELAKWVKVIESLSKLLKSEFDNENLILYDDIMEAEGLKGIYDLFTERINYTFNQIFTKAISNEKLQNVLNYFTKDFLFFYLSVKKFSNTSGCPFKIFNFSEIKNIFIEKYKKSLSENFSRAFNLIKTIEKNSTNMDNPETLKSNITEYLHNYIIQINSVFVDLENEFENEMVDDPVINELISLFNKSLNELIFNQIYPILNNILSLSKINANKPQTQQSNDIISNIKIFYYYTSILMRTNQFFEEILIKDNNIGLVTIDLQLSLENQLSDIYNQFYNTYIFKIVKEIKIIYINKEFIYLKTFLEKISVLLNDFFSGITEELMKYKFFEKKLIKFIVYAYLYVMLVLVLSIPPIENKDNIVFVDFFLNIFNGIFKLKEVPLFIVIHEDIKKVLSISESELKENLLPTVGSLKKHQVLLFKIRNLFFNENVLVKFLQENKMNIETFGKILGLIYMNNCHIKSDNFILVENQNNLLEIVNNFLG